MANLGSIDDSIDEWLLIAQQPMSLGPWPPVLSSKFQYWIARLEGILDLLENEMLVVAGVAITDQSVSLLAMKIIYTGLTVQQQSDERVYDRNCLFNGVVDSGAGISKYIHERACHHNAGLFVAPVVDLPKHCD